MEEICNLVEYYNTLPLSSLLDSVFRSKMKSKAELRIMLYFFFMLHSLFVILSFSPPILFTKKNLQQKEQFFESCSIVVAALRSSANATADELVCTKGSFSWDLESGHEFKLFSSNNWIFKFFFLMVFAIKMLLDNNIYGLLNLLEF